MSQAALGGALVESGALTREDLEKAEGAAQKRGVPLEKAIVSLGLATEAAVYRAVAKSQGLKFVDPDKFRVNPELLERLPSEQCVQNEVLPVVEKNGVFWVAIDDPIRSFVADNIGFMVGCEVQCALMPPGAFRKQLNRLTGSGSAGPGTQLQADAADEDGDGPVVRLVQKIVGEALDARASDIHVEPFEGRVRVRYRVDGVLREQASLERDLLGPLTSRLKIMASMDIAEKRKPQDGRIDFRGTGRAIDIRTSVLPSNHGESVVMRLLDKESNLLDLPGLGFRGADLERFERTIQRPNGIVLVTGPTGSGKTTTLYAALQTLNRPDVKIITAEDPVEFNIGGINQCQVRSTIGLDFARILRAMLRQAPNIILVGEIRDAETAEIAVQAALTGHLVFSTLHTNDAPSAVTRLADMGVKPFLVSAALQAVLAQRLVRVLCTECREAYAPPELERRSLGVDDARVGDRPFYRAVGCDACEGRGYRGRLGIFELMVMDTTLREMTFRRESAHRLRDYARTSVGMSSLLEDGIAKILDGTTSVEELLRVTAAS